MSTAVCLDDTIAVNPEAVLWYCCDGFLVGSHRLSYHVYHLGQHKKPVSTYRTA